jgi:AAA domain
MVTAPPGPGDDPQLKALTTLAGWRQFAGEVPSVPQLLDPGVWQDLDSGKRAAYDDDRIAHHSRLLVVQTPAVRDVVTAGRRLAHMNRSAHYGRSGLIVSGPARTGKTTAITQLGKTIEVIHRRRYPRCSDDIPVVYITVPPAATPRMIAAEFARFLGIPVTQRGNITDIIESVCGVCTDARTSVICVDEIHNLNIATRVGGEASDTLKYFSERIPATFVLAGISVERAGLLSGPRGEQIAGRYSMVRTSPFPLDEQWAALIAALDGSLRLHRHQAGSLPGLASYLHERTGGMIGSLLWLIRSAAIQAVIDGTEQVTRKTMDAIPVDIASQTASRAERRREHP